MLVSFLIVPVLACSLIVTLKIWDTNEDFIFDYALKIEDQGHIVFVLSVILSET